MKQKTVKAAAKRIKITGKGKMMRRKMSAQHLSMGKSKRVRRDSNKFAQVSRADSKRLKKLIPNR